MAQHLAHVTLVVDDYDRAIAYYTQVLGFELIDDIDQGHKRWVTVRPKGASECSLLLARASSDVQTQYIGNQTGGRVSFFLHTNDFWTDYAQLKTRGVDFAETPREEPYGTVVVFIDIYGNRWDLLQYRYTI
ncbi:MAG: VOC family protein [Formosimonas sp.]